MQTINASPGELEPVFEAMVDRTIRLCDATAGTLFIVAGDTVPLRSHRNLPDAFVEYLAREPPSLDAGSLLAHSIRECTPINVADLTESPPYRAGVSLAVAAVELGLIRSICWVPLVHAGRALGLFSISRREVRPFTARQMALLEDFAGQATIAMVNARLLTEQREALEQQTATAEVLGVINGSPGNLMPVFNAMLERALRLCGAYGGGLLIQDGGSLKYQALLGMPASFTALRLGQATPITQDSPPGRMFHSGRTVQVVDTLTDPYFVTRPELRDETTGLGGARSVLNVPLLKDDAVLGAFVIFRESPGTWPDRQIALLENFAAQAVIAMENARLITETREALEQQTATAEVLGVINASPGNLTPVFDAMLEKAMRLCEASFGLLVIADGDTARLVTSRDIPIAFRDYWDREPIKLDPETFLGRALRDMALVHVPDATMEQPYLQRRPVAVAAVELGGIRTMLMVPMVQDGRSLGLFTVYRQEVRPFSDKQISLLENFAAQAVIAMENARLIDEIRAARDEAESTLENLRRTQDRLVQTEKMASLGQLTAGIAHEIKNPLNFFNNFSDLSTDLLDELNEAVAPGRFDLPEDTRAEIDEITETLKSNLQKIAEHGRRADSIVKNMLLHSRSGVSERRAVDLNATAEEALNLAYHGARAETPGFNITMEKDFDPTVGAVELYPQEISRVLVNLINNGFYAAHKRAEKGTEPGLEPTLLLSTKNLGDQIEIRVRDNGTGIPADVQDKIFEPFFTTKPAGQGTGLGLSLSFDIVVKQHGGQLSVDSEPGVFTEFTITLPRRLTAAEGGKS